MPLRIAFDLDGVLADMEAELGRQAGLLFRGDEQADADGVDDSSPQGAPPLTTLQMTPRRVRLLWRHVEAIDNFWETLDELEPGAVARLAELAGANGLSRLSMGTSQDWRVALEEGATIIRLGSALFV